MWALQTQTVNGYLKHAVPHKKFAPKNQNVPAAVSFPVSKGTITYHQ